MASNLDIDVKNAKALGLSYGQYKALHCDPNAAPTKKQKRRESTKICPMCGNFVFWPQRKYCSEECRNEAHSTRERYDSEQTQRDKDGEQDADS